MWLAESLLPSRTKTCFRHRTYRRFHTDTTNTAAPPLKRIGGAFHISRPTRSRMEPASASTSGPECPWHRADHHRLEIPANSRATVVIVSPCRVVKTLKPRDESTPAYAAMHIGHANFESRATPIPGTTVITSGHFLCPSILLILTLGGSRSGAFFQSFANRTLQGASVALAGLDQAR
jgi:hypothetical protein